MTDWTEPIADHRLLMLSDLNGPEGKIVFQTSRGPLMELSDRFKTDSKTGISRLKLPLQMQSKNSRRGFKLQPSSLGTI